MTEETRTSQDRFAVRLGLFLTAVGVRGLSRERVLGLVGMNRLHAVEHIAVGVAGIAAGAARTGVRGPRRRCSARRGRAWSSAVDESVWFRDLFNADRRTTAVQLAVALVSLRTFRSDSE